MTPPKNITNSVGDFNEKFTPFVEREKIFDGKFCLEFWESRLLLIFDLFVVNMKIESASCDFIIYYLTYIIGRRFHVRPYKGLSTAGTP